MGNETLEIKVAIQIIKPVSEVFEAIVDPVKMSNYFISNGSGRMEEGKDLSWQFNFLTCLKAYLEYGINLRKGAFDFMSDKK
jgi:uncharacterized protein YndB with AHSA1/START domain